jgi:hypothetical protein
MFGQDERLFIESLKTANESTRTAKVTLNRLKAIKTRITNEVDKECFCSSVRRKIWYKNFMEWYESTTR